MRVCGVELKDNEAIVCLLSLDQGLFDIPDCKLKRIPFQNVNSRSHLQQFQQTFKQFCDDSNVDRVVIRERMRKGKFAGGAVSFKLEAAIELIDSLDVAILSPKQIKTALAADPLPIDYVDTGLKPFQEHAFLTAYASLR